MYSYVYYSYHYPYNRNLRHSLSVFPFVTITVHRDLLTTKRAHLPRLGQKSAWERRDVVNGMGPHETCLSSCVTV